MCQSPSSDNEINELLKAEADLQAAARSLNKADALLASLPKITATVQLPKLLHECEQCGNSYMPRMLMGNYICDECREENASGRIEDSYERSHRMGPI